MTGSYPYMLLIIRGDVEIRPRRLRRRAAAPRNRERHLREDRGLGLYDAYLARTRPVGTPLADADAAVDNALAQARPTEAAQIRVSCAPRDCAH